MKSLGTALGKEAQRAIIGGKTAAPGGTCYITASGGNSLSYSAPVSGSCSSQSSQANDLCVSLLNGGGGTLAGQYTSCHYDCDCDGIGH